MRKKEQKPEQGPKIQRRIIALAYVVLAFVFIPLPSRATGDEPTAVEDGSHLDVQSKWGTKIFPSELDLNVTDGYSIKIPLDSLKPPPPEPAPEKPAAPEEPRKPSSAPESEEDDEVKKRPHHEVIQDDDPDEKAEPEKKDPKEQKITVEIDDTDRLVVEANHLYNTAEYFEANEVVDELLRKKPKYLRGWVMKGSLMYVLGHKDLAKEAWQQAQSIDPENSEVKYYLGRYR